MVLDCLNNPDPKATYNGQLVRHVKRCAENPYYMHLTDTALTLGYTDMEIVIKTFNVSYKAGVKTVNDIGKRSDEELLSVRNLGVKMLEFMRTAFELHGDKTEQPEKPNTVPLVVVHKYNDGWQLVVDTETRVEYICGQHNRVFPRLNPDGKPVLWTEDFPTS